MQPMRLWARVLLFACGASASDPRSLDRYPASRLMPVLRGAGYHWVHVSGKPAGRKKAPVIVSNHRFARDP